MERGIERTLMDFEKVFGDLLEALGDGVAVAWAQCHDFQDQHVESAFEEIGFVLGHLDRYLVVRHIALDARNVNW
jgi:hypothetical protein